MADGRLVLRCYRSKVSANRWVGADIRVLVALEDDYRAYREMIAGGLRLLRPGTDVKSTTLEALEEELERFDPQVVICSSYDEVEPEGRPAWIELSLDPTQPTKISVGSHSLELTNPGVEALLKVIDELRVTLQH